MTGEDEFGVKCIDFERKAWSKWNYQNSLDLPTINDEGSVPTSTYR